MINVHQKKPFLMSTSGIQDAYNVNETKINLKHLKDIKKYRRPPRNVNSKNMPVLRYYNAIVSTSIDINNFVRDNINIRKKIEKNRKELKKKFNKSYNVKKKTFKLICKKEFELKMYKLKLKISKTLKRNNILKVNMDNRPKYVDNNNNMKLVHTVNDVNSCDGNSVVVDDGDDIREDSSNITNSRDYLDEESNSKLIGRANVELKDIDYHISTYWKAKNSRTKTIISWKAYIRKFKDRNKKHMNNNYRVFSNFIDGNNRKYSRDYHKVYGDHTYVYKIIMKDINKGKSYKVDVLGNMSNEKKGKHCLNGTYMTNPDCHGIDGTQNSGEFLKRTNSNEDKLSRMNGDFIDRDCGNEIFNNLSLNEDQTCEKGNLKYFVVGDINAGDYSSVVNKDMSIDTFKEVCHDRDNKDGGVDLVYRDTNSSAEGRNFNENNDLILKDMNNARNVESTYEGDNVDNEEDGSKRFDESSKAYVNHAEVNVDVIEERNEDKSNKGNIVTIYDSLFDQNTYLEKHFNNNSDNNSDINNEENRNEVFHNAMSNKENITQVEVKEEEYIHIYEVSCTDTGGVYLSQDEYSDVEVDGVMFSMCKRNDIANSSGGNDIINNDDVEECRTEINTDQFRSERNLSETNCKVETETCTGQSDATVSGSGLSINERKNKDQISKDNDKSHTEAVKKKIVIPRGFCNPQGFCFLNSVVQMLRGSIDFHYNIIEYFKSNTINQYQIECKEKNFVKYFCILFNSLEEDNTESIENILHEVQRYFIESKNGDDVQKCFMSILTAINTVTKTVGTYTCTENDKVEESFIKNRMKNQGFIFESFYGQTSNSKQCNRCKHKISEKFNLFKCLTLPVPQSKETITLEECIKCFLKESSTDVEEPLDCDCENGSTDISFFTKITHSPKYLFLYLTRGSYYTGGEKNRTFVDSEEIISVDTTRGLVKYRCISIIDHKGDNDYGHYYCKCNYEGQCWWLINDTEVTEIGTSFTGIISSNTIAFMFVKVE